MGFASRYRSGNHPRMAPRSAPPPTSPGAPTRLQMHQTAIASNYRFAAYGMRVILALSRIDESFAHESDSWITHKWGTACRVMKGPVVTVEDRSRGMIPRHKTVCSQARK